MSTRLRTVKTILWALLGVLSVVTVVRFTQGLGATTALTDATPWGLWIAFDVMAGVALAAGGFVLTATVYIFHLGRFRPFVRPAILTALLGYLAVAVGLIYDLGLPWHMWYLTFSPQHHSVLFEVGMCVMLYLTVLSLEFGPVILEHPLFSASIFHRIHAVLKKAVIPLVIAGIVLSTLHQSSLGSLFLIAPHRVHPLWYSPIIWVLFFVSAIGLGLMTVTLESFVSRWLFGHELKLKLLGGLAKAAAVVLFLYAGLRLGDLALRGKLGLAFDGSAYANLFLFEILLAALLPATLLSIPRVRSSAAGLASAAVMAVLGVMGYRFDVCIVAFRRPEGMAYFPSWMELAVSLGIVAGAALVFIFFVEHLRVYAPEEEAEEGEQARRRPVFSPVSTASMLPANQADPRRYSLAALIGIAAAVALLPDEVTQGSTAMRVPVHETRTLPGYVAARSGEPGHTFALAPRRGETPDGDPVSLMVIDGNRDGRWVLFHHAGHAQKLGERDSCKLCHHQEMPFQEQTPCSDCHRDMYSPTDLFVHSSHVDKLGGNASCVRCHADGEVKTRASSEACSECHGDMVVEGSRVEPPKTGMSGLAPGYMTAMHELCIRCHEEQLQAAPSDYVETFAECGNCHRETDGSTLLHLRPYATGRSE